VFTLSPAHTDLLTYDVGYIHWHNLLRIDLTLLLFLEDREIVYPGSTDSVQLPMTHIHISHWRHSVTNKSLSKQLTLPMPGTNIQPKSIFSVQCSISVCCLQLLLVVIKTCCFHFILSSHFHVFLGHPPPCIHCSTSFAILRLLNRCSSQFHFNIFISSNTVFRSVFLYSSL